MKWLLDFLKGNWLKHPFHPVIVRVPIWVGVPPKRS